METVVIEPKGHVPTDDIQTDPKGTIWLVNAAFVVKNWNQPGVGFRFELDGKALTNGTNYRFGYEQTATGKDLVIWLNKTLDLNERDEHRAEISIIPDPPNGN